MLDLTLSLSTGNSRKMVIQQIESSRSFHSSILNAGTSIPSSSVTHPGYIFNTLKEFNDEKKPTIDQVSEDEKGCSKTIQFFPVNSETDVNEGRGESSVLQRNEGLDLNLTCGRTNWTTEREILEYRPSLKKNRRGRRRTSSQYRGVTFYRRTGRWESHIWDCGTGKQVYLGGFDTAPAAARAYDLAAIKFRGAEAYLNFDVDNYKDDVKYMHAFSKDEFVMRLRSRLNTSAVRSDRGFVM